MDNHINKMVTKINNMSKRKEMIFKGWKWKNGKSDSTKSVINVYIKTGSFNKIKSNVSSLEKYLLS